MKKLFIIVGALVLAASTISAQELTLDQILDKYYKANGIDKLQKVSSIIMTGSITTNVIMPYKIYKLRPNKYRLERDVVDITGLTVYDGQTGWNTAPWTKNPNPTLLPPQILPEVQVQADFDGILYSWKEKGHNLELAGKEKVGESNAYKLKVTRKDGGIEYEYIDCSNFLLIRRLSYRNIRGNDTEFENLYTDYRNVEGVMFAFMTTTNVGGQTNSEIQFDTIELNQPIDEALFVMPK